MLPPPTIHTADQKLANTTRSYGNILWHVAMEKVKIQNTDSITWVWLPQHHEVKKIVSGAILNQRLYQKFDVKLLRQDRWMKRQKNYIIFNKY
jgi:hypothetical protein